MTDEKRDAMLATLATECQRIDDEHTVLMSVFGKINLFLFTLVAETLIFAITVCYIFWLVRPI